MFAEMFLPFFFLFSQILVRNKEEKKNPQIYVKYAKELVSKKNNKLKKKTKKI